MTYLTSALTEQFTEAITTGINAGLILCAILIGISLAIFCLYVAVGTWVVKKVWFSNWGGDPRRYR